MKTEASGPARAREGIEGPPERAAAVGGRTPPPSSQRDLTKGPIAPALLAFSLPMLGTSILQSLDGSINTIWLGRFLGEKAVAATANANIVMFLAFGAVFGFGMAATVLIGQAWGRGDVDAARRTFASSCGLIVAGSLVVVLFAYPLAPRILESLGTPSAVADDALAYLRVIFLGLPAMMTLQLVFMALRGSGDSMTPLWFMLVSVILDLVLNPMLILGVGPFPRMGIAGSATATLAANVMALTGMILFMNARELPMRLKGAELRYLWPAWSLVGTILGKGLPIGAQMLTMSVAGLAMVGLVNRHGLATVAAYGVAQQLWSYVQMPAMAIGAGVSTMVAQNIGAGAWARVPRIAGAGFAIGVAITGAFCVAVVILGRPLLSIFLPAGSEALPIAAHVNAVVVWNFVLFGGAMVLLGVVRANGAVWGPLAILAVAMFAVQLGFATAFDERLGVDALWFSFLVGSAVALVLSTLYYRFSDWRQGSVLPPQECEKHVRATAQPTGGFRPVAA